MNIKQYILGLSFSLLAYGEGGDHRVWTSSDGKKTFKGEYLKVEGSTVFLIKEGQEEISFPISKLHAEDIMWLKKRVKQGERMPEGAVFDSIVLGDSRDLVLEKLNKSKIIIKDREDKSVFSTNNAFDGLYKTKEDLGGLCFRFYSDWEDDCISGIELRSERVRHSEYPDGLNLAWLEIAALLKQLHGPPKKENPDLPTSSEIKAGASLIGTHLWKLESGDTIILAVANQPDKEEAFLLVKIDRHE